MLEEQYDKLMYAAANHKYVSLAINEDGSPIRQGSVPWERTVNAFNMRTPNITIAARDLKDPKIIEALKRAHFLGCYIFVPLEKEMYTHLAQFDELADVYIKDGRNIDNLGFMENMTDLFMFYLEDASIENLESLVSVMGKNRKTPGKCIAFKNCDIKDVSSLTDMDFSISELLIWPAEGDFKERWKLPYRPGIFRFYR